MYPGLQWTICPHQHHPHHHFYLHQPVSNSQVQIENLVWKHLLQFLTVNLPSVMFLTMCFLLFGMWSTGHHKLSPGQLLLFFIIFNIFTLPVKTCLLKIYNLMKRLDLETKIYLVCLALPVNLMLVLCTHIYIYIYNNKVL